MRTRTLYEVSLERKEQSEALQAKWERRIEIVLWLALVAVAFWAGA